MRRRQQGALPQQVAVGRIFCQQLGQAGVDSLAHLLGCRIGKGDHQNPVGIHRMFEVGEDQAAAVMALMTEEKYTDVTALEDTAGIRRVVVGRI